MLDETPIVVPEEGEVIIPWPVGLPRPPSMKQLVTELDEPEESKNAPKCVVFNANTVEGLAMVRVLSGQGFPVVAAVRVYTSKKTKELVKLENVIVKVAQVADTVSLMKAAEGCHRAYLVTPHGDRFPNEVEENIAIGILEATAKVGIKQFVMATFENVEELSQSSLDSDLASRRGMHGIDNVAQKLGVSLSHMKTCYHTLGGIRQSRTVIHGPRGKPVVKTFM